MKIELLQQRIIVINQLKAVLEGLAPKIARELENFLG